MEALPGGYYGPQALNENRGRISDAFIADDALDEQANARLWRETEKLVGHQWNIAAQKLQPVIKGGQ